jgi:hypothetical protein
MENKIYRPSVRYDHRYKDYVDRVKEASGLDGAQIIRLALFVASSNPQFAAKIKEYATKEDVKLPMPRWDKKDDNMWLLQQGEEERTRTHIKEEGEPITLMGAINGGGIVARV